jgi:hypothetical protein
LRPPDLTAAIVDTARTLLLQEGDRDAAQAVTIGTIAGAAGPLAQLRNLLRKIFPPHHELADTYGVPARSWQVWLRYPVRWRDLWRRYRLPLWQLLRGDRPAHAALAAGMAGRHLADWLVAPPPPAPDPKA